MMISIDLVTWRSVKGPGWSSSDSPSWLSGILASLKPNVFQKLQTLLSSLSQWLEDKVKLLHLASQAWADLCTVLFQCVIPHSSHYQLCELFEVYFLTALIWPLFFAQNTSFLLHLSNCYSSSGNNLSVTSLVRPSLIQDEGRFSEILIFTVITQMTFCFSLSLMSVSLTYFFLSKL